MPHLARDLRGGISEAELEEGMRAVVGGLVPGISRLFDLVVHERYLAVI